MTKRQIREIFRRTFNGQSNVMTPRILEYGQKGEYIFEISKGKFMDEILYGVTVLTASGDKSNLNKAFSTYEEAKEYAENL